MSQTATYAIRFPQFPSLSAFETKKQNKLKKERKNDLFWNSFIIIWIYTMALNISAINGGIMQDEDLVQTLNLGMKGLV